MRTDNSRDVLELVKVLRAICATLPVSEEYVMVHHPAFRLGKKPFVIAGMEEATKGATLSVNLGPEMQAQLLDDARFARTPYIGQHGWVTIARRDLQDDELRALVVGSWRRLANKKQLATLDAAPRENAKAPAKQSANKQAPVKPLGAKQKVPAKRVSAEKKVPAQPSAAKKKPSRPGR